MTRKQSTTPARSDAALFEMIRRHDKLWRELEKRVDSDDPHRAAMAREAEMLAVTIVATEVNTPRALAGKRRVIDREMFDRDEIVRLVLSADAERIAAARTSTATGPHATA